jgi:hypothetical protein
LLLRDGRRSYSQQGQGGSQQQQQNQQEVMQKSQKLMMIQKGLQRHHSVPSFSSASFSDAFHVEDSRLASGFGATFQPQRQRHHRSDHLYSPNENNEHEDQEDQGNDDDDDDYDSHIPPRTSSLPPYTLKPSQKDSYTNGNESTEETDPEDPRFKRVSKMLENLLVNATRAVETPQPDLRGLLSSSTSEVSEASENSVSPEMMSSELEYESDLEGYGDVIGHHIQHQHHPFQDEIIQHDVGMSRRFDVIRPDSLESYSELYNLDSGEVGRAMYGYGERLDVDGVSYASLSSSDELEARQNRNSNNLNQIERHQLHSYLYQSQLQQQERFGNRIEFSEAEEEEEEDPAESLIYHKKLLDTFSSGPTDSSSLSSAPSSISALRHDHSPVIGARNDGNVKRKGNLGGSGLRLSTSTLLSENASTTSHATSIMSIPNSRTIKNQKLSSASPAHTNATILLSPPPEALVMSPWTARTQGPIGIGAGSSTSSSSSLVPISGASLSESHVESGSGKGNIQGEEQLELDVYQELRWQIEEQRRVVQSKQQKQKKVEVSATNSISKKEVGGGIDVQLDKAMERWKEQRSKLQSNGKNGKETITKVEGSAAVDTAKLLVDIQVSLLLMVATSAWTFAVSAASSLAPKRLPLLGGGRSRDSRKVTEEISESSLDSYIHDGDFDDLGRQEEKTVATLYDFLPPKTVVYTPTSARMAATTTALMPASFPSKNASASASLRTSHASVTPSPPPPTSNLDDDASSTRAPVSLESPTASPSSSPSPSPPSPSSSPSPPLPMDALERYRNRQKRREKARVMMQKRRMEQGKKMSVRRVSLEELGM